jgi:hypothetical protein
MTQYSSVVERQKIKLEAEEWGKKLKDLHVHSLSSMWYDDRPQDTQNGAVTDITYCSGIVERWKDGKLIHTFGKRLKGEELVDAYIRGGS